MARPIVRFRRTNSPILYLVLGELAAAMLAIGCGMPGAPSPPSLRLPARVGSLAAARSGDTVKLTWTMPGRTTDGIALKQEVSVQVCRAIENGTCNQIAQLAMRPGLAASYENPLTGSLAHGPAQLLTYRVILRNHAGKSAGPSNAAYAAAGDAPPALTGLTAQVRQGSVLLGWHSASQKRFEPHSPAGQAASPRLAIRIERTIVQAKIQKPKSAKSSSPSKSKPGGNRPILPPSGPPTKQMLTVPIQKSDPGHAIDSSIEMNQEYRYVVERVASLVLDGHSVEIEGQPSTPLEVATTDIFPPPTPSGLVAVADPAGGAVDLSWTPDTASDLAGYFLYRRDVGSNVPSQSISPLDHPLTAPTFRDLNVEAGHTYAYSVSAIDESGNESAHSPEVVAPVPSR